MASKGSGFLTGLFIGGLVGTAIGILVAPQRGVETRAGLRAKTGGLREIAEEMAAQGRERFRAAVGEGMTAAARIRRRPRSPVDFGNGDVASERE